MVHREKGCPQGELRGSSRVCKAEQTTGSWCSSPSPALSHVQWAVLPTAALVTCSTVPMLLLKLSRAVDRDNACSSEHELLHGFMQQAEPCSVSQDTHHSSLGSTCTSPAVLGTPGVGKGSVSATSTQQCLHHSWVLTSLRPTQQLWGDTVSSQPEEALGKQREVPWGGGGLQGSLLQNLTCDMSWKRSICSPPPTAMSLK